MIAAAGSGERLGAGGPKAFVEVAGRPLLEWSLAAFEAAKSVAAVVVAAPPGSEAQVREAGEAAGVASLEVVAGGETRSESVAAAVELVGSDVVAIHDAARPLVTAELIDAIVAELEASPDADGVIAAAPMTDTVKEAGGATVGERMVGKKVGKNVGKNVGRTLDRSTLWAAQTPQAFRTEKLRAVLGSDSEATDEAMLIEAAGGKVVLHEAPSKNLKVTTADDLRTAEALLEG